MLGTLGALIIGDNEEMKALMVANDWYVALVKLIYLKMAYCYAKQKAILASRSMGKCWFGYMSSPWSHYCARNGSASQSI